MPWSNFSLSSPLPSLWSTKTPLAFFNLRTMSLYSPKLLSISLSLSFSEHPPPIYLNPCSLPQLPIPAHFWISGITFRLLSKTPFPASTHDPSLPQQDSRTTSVEPKAEQEQISFFLKSPIDVFSQKFHILFKFYRKKIMKGRDFPTLN